MNNLLGFVQEMLNICDVIDELKIINVNKFGLHSTEPSNLEKEIAYKINDIFIDLVYNSQITQVTSLTLKENNYSDISVETVEQASQIASQSQSHTKFFQNSTVSSDYNDEDNEVINGEKFSLEYMQKVIKFRDEHKYAPFATIKHNFPRVKHYNYIERFRKRLESSETRIEKLTKITNFVFEKFIYARQSLLPVHDIDLQRWAIQNAQEIHINNFKACPLWLYFFKFNFGIVFRKVTKVVTKISEEANIAEDASQFIYYVQPIILRVHASHVINTDQSGFHYEMYSKRTLSLSGEQSTSLCVNSLNAISHSYTIKPAITMEGKLFPKFLICLQDKSGRFGPQISENLPKFKNVVIKCSNSGKMTKELVSEFNIEIIKLQFSTDFVYLVDSWNGHTDEEIYTTIFENQCKFLKIPPHCTSLI